MAYNTRSITFALLIMKNLMTTLDNASVVVVKYYYTMYLVPLGVTSVLLNLIQYTHAMLIMMI